MKQIEIKVSSPTFIPNRATTFAVGCDLKARLTDDVLKEMVNAGFRLVDNGFKLPPLSRAKIPTGVFLNMPEDIEAQIRPTSGNAIKLGLTVLNSPGTIDPDFKQEVCVIVYNSDPKFEAKILNGMKIAQIVFAKTESLPFKVVDEFSEQLDSNRTDGFGHTDSMYLKNIE